MAKDIPPTLSVVVIGRNESKRLERSLASARAMDYPKDEMEIIFVDCGSSDDSSEKARQAGVKVIALRPEHPSPGLARNAGWRAATAPLVLFLDGDTVIDPDFVRRALPEFEDPAVGAVWGRVREMDPNRSIYQRVLDVHWRALAPSRRGPTNTCLGSALMRRSVLQVVEGYGDRLLQWEETEMSWRMKKQGHMTLHVDYPMAEHDASMTCWRQYWRRGCRGGYGAGQLSHRYRASNYPLRNRFRRHWFWGVFLISLPLLGLGVSLAACSWLPVVLACSVPVLLTLWGAWRAWRYTNDLVTSLCYGIHTWVLHIPVLFGTFLHLLDHRFGIQGRFISYK